MSSVPGPSSIAISGDSPVEGKLNEAIPGSPKFGPKIIGKGGPPADVPRDDTAQPPKTDDQPPKTDDQLPKTDDQLPKTDDQSPKTDDQSPKTGDEPPDDQRPTEATSPPADKAQGWVRFVHPDGWIYFFKQHDDELEGIKYHEIRSAPQDEIATNATLNTSAPAAAANHERLSKVKGPGRAVALDFAVVVIQTYVDDRRWYASVDKALLSRQWHTDEEANKLQLNYWELMYEYPAHHSLPPGAVTAARQALTCYFMEGLVRKSGTRAPFTLAESKELLESFDVIEKNNNEKDLEQPPATAQLPLPPPMKAILVSWVLLNVAKHRQINKYGRNTYEEAVKDKCLEEPSYMFMIVSSICLFAPMYHRIRIYAAKKSVDLRGNRGAWAEYIDALVEGSSTFNLAATVLLSASVGLLAVPGVDSVTRIIVLLSVVLTLGSIITGVYLVRHEQSGGKSLEQFGSLLHGELGIDLLAIILSTPFVFMAWGVTTFLVAVISYSFLGFQTTIEGSNVPIRGRAFISVLVLAIVVPTVVLISVFLFWCVRKCRRRGMD